MKNIVPVKATPEGISNAIDKMSRGVPKGKYVREFIFNAFDAFKRSGSEQGGTITISRDRLRPNKMVIANSTPASSLTEDIARNSLNCVFEPQSGHEENHGIGAKIAYLPQNPQGLLFRCRNTGGALGPYQFELHKNEQNLYGLKKFYKDGDQRAFMFAEVDEDEFCYLDSETEVVLLGKTEDDDTWISTLEDLSTHQHGQTFAGWGIVNHIGRILWQSPVENVELRIAIYKKNGELDRQPVKATYLKSMMESQTPSSNGEIKGCHGRLEHPDGAKINYYAVPFERGKKSKNKPSGFIGYLHDNEIFTNKGKTPNAIKRDFSLAGVVTHHRHVAIIVKFPDSFKLTPLLDRSDVTDENNVRADTLLDKYLEYFRENMPMNLKDWMEHHFIENNTSIEKEAQKFYNKKSSNVPLGSGNTTEGSNSSAGGSSTTQTKTNSSGKTPKRRSSKTGNKFLSVGTPPAFRMGEEGEETSLIYFDHVGYSITINVENAIFTNIENNLLNKFKLDKVIKNSLAEEIYMKTCEYHAMLLDSYPTESEVELSDRMSEERLDPLAVGAQETAIARIERAIKKQQKLSILAA